MYVLGEQVSAQIGPQWCPGSPWGSLSPIRQLRGLWQEVQRDFPLRFSRDVLKNMTVILCVFMCMHRDVFAYLCVVVQTCGARGQQSARVPSIWFFETKYLPSSWLQGFLCIQFSSARITTPVYLHGGQTSNSGPHACVASTLLTDPSPHFHSNVYTEVWQNTFWSIALSVKLSSDAVTELFLQQ